MDANEVLTYLKRKGTRSVCGGNLRLARRLRRQTVGLHRHGAVMLTVYYYFAKLAPGLHK